LPAGWTGQFNPASPILDPGEEITVDAAMDPSNTFHGSLPVNIHVFHEAGLTGGMTILVERA
jgi:hypothetical protein